MRITTAGGAALLLALLQLVAPAAADTPAAPPARLEPAVCPAPRATRERSLLTWNVGTVNPRDVRLPDRFEAGVADLISAANADVVLLQELQGLEQVRRLQADLRLRGQEYALSLESSDPRREDGRAMAILHRAKALGTTSLHTSVGAGFRAQAVLLPGLTVVGVHAPTSLEHRQAFFPQLAAWARRLPPPVVIAGDFNMGPHRGAGGSFFLPWTWRHDRKLYHDLARDFPVHTSVPSTTIYGQLYDHVMATSGAVVSQEVLTGHRWFPQDHEPLRVTLALPVVSVEAPGLVDALLAPR